MASPRQMEGAVVVVYADDRGWRMAVDVALRAAGVRTRLASRPAELAKSLVDGGVRLLVAGPLAADGAVIDTLRARCAVMHTSPGDTIDDIVRRARHQLDAVGPHPHDRQVTSSE